MLATKARRPPRPPPHLPRSLPPLRSAPHIPSGAGANGRANTPIRGMRSARPSVIHNKRRPTAACADARTVASASRESSAPLTSKAMRCAPRVESGATKEVKLAEVVATKGRSEETVPTPSPEPAPCATAVGAQTFASSARPLPCYSRFAAQIYPHASSERRSSLIATTRPLANSLGACCLRIGCRMPS